MGLVRLRVISPLLLMTILILSSGPLVNSELDLRGPEIDLLRSKVVVSPDAQLYGMMATPPGLDVVTDLMRPADIDTLYTAGMTITASPGFHMADIAFNIRSDQSYRRRSDHALVAAVLSDVWFRLALFKCSNQYESILSTYRYTATPIHSLVPPAQAVWYNPAVPKVEYNPGDKIATTKWPEDDSACGVLRYAGYTYDGTVDNWRTPEAWGSETGGKLIPRLDCWWLLVAGWWSPPYLESWIVDCHDIGLTSVHHAAGDYLYIDHYVFQEADFDMFLWFWGLNRFPDHLYDLCHSSQDCALHPGRYNTPGIHDDHLDELVETVNFSLNHTAKIKACHETQRVLYDINYPDCAFAYMPLYSRTYFNAHMKGLKGIVNSPGYGSHNKWTLLNMHWEPNHPNARIEDGKSVVVWALGEEPWSLNPCSAGTFYDRCVIEPTLDGLLAMNPYTHEDVPWIATGWSVEGPITGTVTLDSENRYLGVPAGGTVDLVDGAEFTFNLRSDVHWQCGNLYLPSDAEFSLEFLRNNQVPRYASAWEHIVDVQVINETAFTIYSDAASQWLLADFASTATLLPPPVWRWLDGRGPNEILGYDPSTNRTKPLGAGDRFGDRDPATGQPVGAVTQLYGTGPFIFDYYDPATMTAEESRNGYYFMTPDEIGDLLVDLFHKCGDLNRDGWVWTEDKYRWGQAFLTYPGDAAYDAHADLNGDGDIDFADGAIISANWGDKKEYPQY